MTVFLGDLCIDSRCTYMHTPDEIELSLNSIGSFMAKALIDGQTLGVSLSPLLLIWMTGNSPTLDDLKYIEPDYYRGLNWVLNNPIQDMELTYTVSFDVDDEARVVELKAFGMSIDVEEEDKEEYVQLLTDWLVKKRYVHLFIVFIHVC